MERHKTIYMYVKNNKLDIDKIIDEYSGYLYKIVENAGSFSKEDIEEIVSDTFLILWNNQYKLDLNKELSPYLVGIVKNLIKQKYKIFYKVNDNIEDFENKLFESENIDLTLENKDINEKIILILNKLKQEEKDIFYEFYYYQKRIKEIAIMYNISESKVKTKLHRLRNKIRKELLKGGYSLNG